MLQQYFPFILIKSMFNVSVTAHGNITFRVEVSVIEEVPLVGKFSNRSSSGGGKFQ